MILTTWSGGRWDRGELLLALRGRHPGTPRPSRSARGSTRVGQPSTRDAPSFVFRLRDITTKKMFIKRETHFIPGIVMRGLGGRKAKKKPAVI